MSLIILHAHFPNTQTFPQLKEDESVVTQQCRACPQGWEDPRGTPPRPGAPQKA